MENQLKIITTKAADKKAIWNAEQGLGGKTAEEWQNTLCWGWYGVPAAKVLELKNAILDREIFASNYPGTEKQYDLLCKDLRKEFKA